ncbi:MULTISPECIES: urease accessory protein UreD [Elizabethkingia]|uniref:urease accessory protein UreD n=1 Tax=Elizabethkingia TaxID=308865 RepID=UPI000999FDAA|nr:urease accessory protein UreD [Elizabethkingia miricola]MCT3762098.1 urease accessory protein UreD [Elizabethkingia anophelis]OPC32424.1 urease accessory protein UreD [Elizabethkingia miricola]
MDSSLSIIAGYKQGASYVKDLYVSLPFRVVSVGQRKNDNKLYQMVMSSSPGILDGDRYHLEISLEEGAALQLQSQSYQRLFNMEDKATQQLNITMQDNTSFAYVPHPVVPHEDSNFQSKANIRIGKNSQVIISEIITCGRKHYGEVFKLKRFQNLTEIYHEDKLVVKDNVLIQPDLIPINSIGNLEQYTHQGTLIFYSTKENTDRDRLIETVVELAEDKKEELEIGVSAMEDNGFIVRALGHGGESMYNFFLSVQDLLWESE